MAQDASVPIKLDGGLDASAPIMSTYFEDTTELNFPTPPCYDPADPESEGCYTSFLVVSDLEGDGDMDIVFANGGGYYQVGTAEPSVVYLNDGKGGFRDATQTTFGGATSRLRQVAIADVDGDGDKDIYQPGGYGVDLDKLWIQTKPGIFEDKAATLLPSEMLGLDGGVATSTLPPDAGAMTPGLRSKAASAHFGDLDGDGDMDLAIGDWQDNRGSPKTESIVRLYKNDGKGVFTALPLNATPPPLPGPRPTGFADAGFYPDGGIILPYLYGAGPLDLDMQDIDGDFDLDLLVIGRNGQSRIFFNDGNFVFTDGTAGYPPKQGPYQYNQELCDIDGDGDLDLLVDNSGGVVRRGQYITQVNINDGKGFFSDQTPLRIKGEPGGDDNAVKCLDVNGDGNFDLVTATLSYKAEKLMVNKGDGTFDYVPNAFPEVDDPSLGIDAADFDGDGFLDVVTGQGEGTPMIDRLYSGYGLSAKDTTPPKFRAVEKPAAKADAPIVIRFAISDAYTSETGEHVASASVEYEIEGEKKTEPALYIGGDIFRAIIPAQADGTVVKVTPSAIDHGGLIGSAPSFEITVGVLPPPSKDAGVPGIDAGTPSTGVDAGLPPTGGDAGTPDDDRDADEGCSIAGSKEHRTSSGVFFILGLTLLALRGSRPFRRFGIFASTMMLLAMGCGDDSGDDDGTPAPTPDAGSVLDAGPAADAATTSDAGRDSGSTAVDSGASTGTDAGSTTPDAGGSLSAAALRGKALADENVCVSCHQADYSGLGFYPNITPDTTNGIGSWSDAEIKAAITDGVDDEGDDLCQLMQRYEFTASELDDLVAFLKSLPAKTKKITGMCPGG
ncbi:MAG TPA: FG-GAP-like repeat-containing protein [Polyangiales bacterium]|nr:FG-GAP-like repeat-containing protein [Polyangiales bacterium]